MTFIKFACIYDDKFNKWKALYKLWFIIINISII
jgi:hypothetical protein